MAKAIKKYGWILLIVCIILYIFPWSHKVDTTIEGVQWRNGDNGLIICDPANNRVKAMEIARLLSSKSKWLSDSNFLK